MERIRLAEVRDEAVALAQAIAFLERRYPEHELLLVPKTHSNSGVHQRPTKESIQKTVDSLLGAPVGDDLEPLPSEKRRLRKTNIRQVVFDAVRGHWRSIQDLADITRLSKKQIRGVLTAPDTRELFDRRDRPDGGKDYKLAGE